ncbi:MAG TPA: hypothetical protein PLN33_04435 [Hyphomonadaceae bacterium]|nr:hypothetical protein [Hyphomonadaceae bacterium]HPN06296.1 hypothetical protein [Hyphomonadaceae bacterium]
MKIKAACVLAIAVGGCAMVEPVEPGITTIAPGVQRIDGSQVRVDEVDLPALEALLAKHGPMQDVIKMIGKTPGGAYPAAGGTESHMYRMEDAATKRKVLVIVFVKNGRVVDSLVTDRTG